ncbi:MAG: hypothetical protein BWX80_03835 [Candidatus Hydrogenedentes bacterium ADurb.Bin101]|nr:MAG: hypothetical protein BWX80_03835 [Candidatus Hydrogenedentes bacterium ADurb.Bin101]
MRIGDVSTLAQVEFFLDGVAAGTHRLSTLPKGLDNPNPEYASTRLRPEYNSYQATFQKWYGVDVPAGNHTLIAEVSDGDWAGVEEYAFRGYVSNRILPVFCEGLSNGTSALLWVLNPEHHWKNVEDNVHVAVLPECTIRVPGMADGNYNCRFWDTWKGEPAGQVAATSSDGLLTIMMPEIGKDLAVLIRKE